MIEKIEGIKGEKMVKNKNKIEEKVPKKKKHTEKGRKTVEKLPKIKKK